MCIDRYSRFYYYIHSSILYSLFDWCCNRFRAHFVNVCCYGFFTTVNILIFVPSCMGKFNVNYFDFIIVVAHYNISVH